MPTRLVGGNINYIMQHGYVGLYVCCMLLCIMYIHRTLIAHGQEAMFCLQ